MAAQVSDRLRRLHRRVFAWFMDRVGAAHGRMVRGHKRRLLGNLHGDILEIGPGTGPNLRYLPRTARIVAVEPNPHMHPYLRREALALGREVEIREGMAQELDLTEASMDAVVSTLVLCSVDAEDGVLSEILRVLKPGGRFVFIEHVAAPDGTWLRRLQRWIRPLWKLLGDGCRPDRETEERIRAAGFERVETERFRLPLPVVSPHVAGTAWKAGGDDGRASPETRERGGAREGPAPSPLRGSERSTGSSRPSPRRTWRRRRPS